VVLVAPVLLGPFVAARSIRWPLLASAGAGAIIPLALVSAVNWLRWDQLSPASYGRALAKLTAANRTAVNATPVETLLLMALVVITVGTIRWLRREGWFERRRRSIALGLALLACAGLLVPAVRIFARNLAHGLAILIVDLRLLPLDAAEPAMMRSPTGGVVYLGTFKKSLLQSCPYLGVLAAFAVTLWRRPPELARLALLAGVPALVVAFYARTAWHGGMAFNLRYLCIALPFLAIIVAHTWQQIVADDGRFQWPAIGVVVAVVAVALSATGLVYPAAQGELGILDVPLGLALVVALASFAWSLAPSRWRARAASASISVAVAWSIVVAVGYDTLRSQTVRSSNYQLGSFVADHLPDDSLLFVEHPDTFYSVLDRRERVRVALPRNDGFRDLQRLTDFHLGHARTVAAVFSERLWAQLAETPLLAPYTLCEVARSGPYSLRLLLARADQPASEALAGSRPVRRPLRDCSRLAELEGS
jgi:hypothetical protein